MFNLGAAYLWCCQLKPIGGFEYVRGRDYFDPPPAPPGGLLMPIRRQYQPQLGVDPVVT